MFVWSHWGLIGYADVDSKEYGSKELHLIDEMQLGTTQDSLCGAAPDHGCLWIDVDGPSPKPTCIACARAKGVQAFKHRFRKLRLIHGGGQ